MQRVVHTSASNLNFVAVVLHFVLFSYKTFFCHFLFVSGVFFDVMAQKGGTLSFLSSFRASKLVINVLWKLWFIDINLMQG